MLSLRNCRAATVVVVEDDDERICSSEIVTEAGFEAVEATTASSAFAILESRSDTVLLFTYIQMPAAWTV